MKYLIVISWMDIIQCIIACLAATLIRSYDISRDFYFSKCGSCTLNSTLSYQLLILCTQKKQLSLWYNNHIASHSTHCFTNPSHHISAAELSPSSDIIHKSFYTSSNQINSFLHRQSKLLILSSLIKKKKKCTLHTVSIQSQDSKLYGYCCLL